MRTRREFQKVFTKRHRLVGQFLCIDCNKAPILRLGISASSRFGTAPERNRFKRLVREVFRLNLALFPQHLEMNVIPRQKAKGISYSAIRNEMVELLSCLSMSHN